MKFLRFLFEKKDKVKDEFESMQTRGVGINPSPKSQSPGIPNKRNKPCYRPEHHGVASLPTTRTLSPGIPGKKVSGSFVDDSDVNKAELQKEGCCYSCKEPKIL